MAMADTIAIIPITTIISPNVKPLSFRMDNKTICPLIIWRQGLEAVYRLMLTAYGVGVGAGVGIKLVFVQGSRHHL